MTPPNYVSQVKWIVDAWKKIDSEIIKSFETCSVATSNVTKMHCLKEDQQTEEVRVLLRGSDGNLELIATPTFDDDVDFQVESIEDVNNLTAKIMEEGVIEF